MSEPTVTLPIPPAWIADADRLTLHVVTPSGVTDIIRFRVVDGQVVLEYPPAVTTTTESITA